MGISPIPNGFRMEVELKISLPGLRREAAHELVDKADIVCPYSNATRDNIGVTLTLVQAAMLFESSQLIGHSRRR